MVRKAHPRVQSALNWLIGHRREANSKGFHDFVCRQDRKLTPEIVVLWFKKHCPELNAHSNGARVFLHNADVSATR
jgi:hypothetical protein